MTKSNLKLDPDQYHDCYMFMVGMVKAKRAREMGAGVKLAYLIGAAERYWERVVVLDEKSYKKQFPFLPDMLKQYERDMDSIFPIRMILK